MKLCEVSEGEFKAFSEKCPATNFLQSMEMYQRYKERGNEAYLVGVKEGSKLRAAALLVSKAKILNQKKFIAPRGFLADFKDPEFEEILKAFTSGVKGFLRERGGAVLEISPNLMRTAEVDDDGVPTGNMRESLETKLLEKYGYKDLGEYEFVKWVYVLPTDGLTEKTLLGHLRADHRRTTRLAIERYGLRTRELEIDELPTLMKLTDASAKRHGFITPEQEYYEEMKRAYGEKVRFLVAEAPKKVIEAFLEKKDATTIKKIAREKTEEYVPIAGAMFVVWKNEIIYLFSGQAEEYRKLGGPHLLQFEMIKTAILKSIPYYNFYGTDPKRGDGVYEFKRGYHGELKEYIGTFMLPISLIGKIFVAKQGYEDVRDIH